MSLTNLLKQAQRSGDNSQNNQAGRDIIQNYGVSVADVVDISQRTAEETALRVISSHQQIEAVSLETEEDESDVFAAASRVYDEALSQEKELWVAYVRKGNILKDRGKLDEAIEAYRQAIAAEPREGAIRNNLALALAAKDKQDAALNEYRRGLTLSPDCVPMHANYAGALVASEDFEGAARQYRLALHIEPEDGQTRYNLAVTLTEHLHDHAGAVAEFQHLLKIQPDYDIGRCYARYGLALALARNGEHQKAVEAFRGILEDDPDYADAYNDLGIALNNLNKPNEAIEAYEQAIRVKPTRARFHNNLGFSLLEMADETRFDRAVRAFQQSILQDPSWHAPYFGLACIYAHRKELVPALAMLSMAIEMDEGWRRVPVRHSQFGPHFDGIRNEPAFQELVAEPLGRQRRREELQEAFPLFEGQESLLPHMKEQWINRIISQEERSEVSPALEAIQVLMFERYFYRQRFDKALEGMKEENPVVAERISEQLRKRGKMPQNPSDDSV